jgi:glycerol uptake facilitator-like aquaporin
MIVHGTITPNQFAIGVSMSDWSSINVVFGLTITIGIYAFGNVSEGHFNPTITIACVQYVNS